MEIWFSVIALLLSLVSFSWTIGSYFSKTHKTAVSTNIIATANLERSLADIPTALKFHGIEQNDLEDAGVTPEEFAYLVASLSVGEVYHRFYNVRGTTAFKPSSYRYTMCAAPATQRAWPLLRRMLSPSAYRDKLENTIKLVESQNQSQQKIERPVRNYNIGSNSQNFSRNPLIEQHNQLYVMSANEDIATARPETLVKL